MADLIGEPGQPHPSQTFTVTLRSVWGDTWEWPVVQLEEATVVHEALAMAPVVVTLAELAP